MDTQALADDLISRITDAKSAQMSNAELRAIVATELNVLVMQARLDERLRITRAPEDGR